MKLARLIWRNAIRNRRRTILTIASIAISIFLIGTLQAVLTSLYSTGNTSSQGDLRVVVHRSTSITQPLPEYYKQRIESVPGVKYVVGVQWFGGQYIDASNFFANFAADAQNFLKVYDDYQVPPDEVSAWENERTAALVGRKLMEKYHWKIGQTITLKGTIFPINPELTIRAVYTDPSDSSQEQALYFHWDYFNELLSEANTVGTFTVKVDNAQDVPKVMDAIDAMFRNTAAETKTETEQAFALSFVSMLGNVRLLLTAISAAVVFTILLVAGNTMAMSIRERTGEVAVLKTLGFRRNMILTLLLGESLAIALLGGILGGLGAKLIYAFIVATYSSAKFMGFFLALLMAWLVGAGAWMLFAGPAAKGGALKIIRLVATTVGALIGFAVGFGFYMSIGYITNLGGFLGHFTVTMEAVGLCLAIAALVGIVSGLWPALRASRISIAEALRFVG
ncbi:MAG TPA: ABC transporter permease [Terriglobia bacterium]|nr:ABC transporter permease [Terriglobia bacterium]